MNKEIKKLWLAGLRSGNYAGGRGALRRPVAGGPDEFDALGVLVDLAADQGVVTRDLVDCPKLGRVYEYGSRRTAVVLPPEVMEWAGIYERNPEVNNGVTCFVISWLSDDGVGHRRIADLIEADPGL